MRNVMALVISVASVTAFGCTAADGVDRKATTGAGGSAPTGAGGNSPTGAGGNGSTGAGGNGSTAADGSSATGGSRPTAAGGSGTTSTSGTSLDGSPSTGAGGTAIVSGGTGLAAKLADKAGTSRTFAWGYGEGTTGLDPYSGPWALGTSLQIFENYLTGPNWTTWNPPDSHGNGTFVTDFAKTAHDHGSVPMFTLYQACSPFASDCFDAAWTKDYFEKYKIMLDRIALFGHPAFVHIEPDLTGFAQQYVDSLQRHNDPTAMRVALSAVPDCATMPENLVGYASCILHMRDLYAKQALIGFDVSDWNTAQDAVAFMLAMGTEKGDYVAVETQDYDAGCFEEASYWNCQRSPSPKYWTDADFATHLEECRLYHSSFNLPIIWWQTPMGVPSSTPGANPWVKQYNTDPEFQYGYRDNRAAYFFGNVQKLVDVGGMAAVFSSAQPSTDIATDIMSDGSHQFKKLLTAYNAAPTALP